MATASKKPATGTAAKKAVAADPELVLLTAIEPIRHDGADMPPGQSFACEPDVAKALLDSKAARIADAE